MNVILKISFRNLVRQKRRNILLGIGIAFGTCILIVANAFSHGLSDILLNKLIAVISGHMVVSMTEQYEGTTKKEIRIIRDKDRIEQLIRKHVEGVDRVDEDVETFARGIGKGVAEFIVMVGIAPNEEFYEWVNVVAGNIRDLDNPEFDNPIAVFEDMAESLNVGLHEPLRTRFETIYGQSQSARFTVVALLKADNPFMSFALFTHLNILKPLLGFQENETASYSVNLTKLERSDVALEQANRLHAALHPNVAGFHGQMLANDHQKEVKVFAVASEEESQQAFVSQMQIVQGSLNETLQDPQAALVSQAIAEELGVTVGDSVRVAYQPKFEESGEPQEFRVGAIFQADDMVQADMLFLPVDRFYKTYMPALPKNVVTLDPGSPLFGTLLKEWALLERSPDREALQKKYKDLKKRGWRGAVLDVQTMYEAASDVLKMEQVLDMVTMIAVLILFFIILIGVVNTLRMTIRERTREIGTIRAIGMRQSDVRWCFMTEVVLLTIFASFVGTVLSFVVMKLLSLYIFQSTESFFTIFLVDKHLHFVATPTNIIINLLVILFIALVTAYFPARRAATMSVASALRHYE